MGYSQPQLAGSPSINTPDFARFQEGKLHASGSTLVLTRVPGSNSQLQLVDCLNPQVRQDSFFGEGDTFSNLRLPIFLVALGLVILYQIKQKRKQEESEDEGQMTIA